VQPAPALVINIHSWATPIIGLAMLLIGLLLGYVGRPLLTGGTPGAAQAPTAIVQPTSAQAQAGNPTDVPTADATAMADLMSTVIQQTRHFKGDENAPITMIEFSDFQ
jgi:hypothetical protein